MFGVEGGHSRSGVTEAEVLWPFVQAQVPYGWRYDLGTP